MYPAIGTVLMKLSPDSKKSSPSHMSPGVTLFVKDLDADVVTVHLSYPADLSIRGHQHSHTGDKVKINDVWVELTTMKTS